MNECVYCGREIYTPTHPNRDANDCIPHLALKPASGAATFTTSVAINSGGANITGNNIYNNALTVGRAIAFGSCC